jgi:hypothetical protein
MDRRIRLFLAGSGVTMLVLAGLLAAAPRALAAKPTIQDIPINSSSVDMTDCGFPVEIDVTGRIRVIAFTDANGNERREIDSFHEQITFTNLNTGKSVTSPSVGPGIVYFNADGSVTLVSSGIFIRIVVPKQGAVIRQIGHTVLLFPPGQFPDGQPELLFAAGPEDALFPALCDLLS